MRTQLEAAGFHTTREDGVECCYARQTKFWVTDPDQALWDIYVFHVFHEDVEEPGEGRVPDVTTVQPVGLVTSRSHAQGGGPEDHREPLRRPGSRPRIGVSSN